MSSATNPDCKLSPSANTASALVRDHAAVTRHARWLQAEPEDELIFAPEDELAITPPKAPPVAPPAVQSDAQPGAAVNSAEVNSAVSAEAVDAARSVKALGAEANAQAAAEPVFDAKAFLKTVPNRPGCYRMYNDRQVVIYVGKAKDLKRRLSSYFLKQGHELKTRLLVAHIAHIEFTVTFSESEALILENELIKKYQPHYNILLRDDKSYPYLYLSTNHEFPGVYFHRGARNKAGEFYGPFPDSSAVKDSLRLLQRIFPIRQCLDNVFAHRSRPCLMAQMGKCLAPCVPMSPEQQANYHEQVELLKLFLQGHNQELFTTMVAKMEEHAAKMEFEQAAQLRDQMTSLRRIQESNSIVSSLSYPVDVIGFALAEGQSCVHVLFIRNGRIFGTRSFFPGNNYGAVPREILLSFLTQFYLNEAHANLIPDEVVVDFDATGAQVTTESDAASAEVGTELSADAHASAAAAANSIEIPIEVPTEGGLARKISRAHALVSEIKGQPDVTSSAAGAAVSGDGEALDAPENDWAESSDATSDSGPDEELGDLPLGNDTGSEAGAAEAESAETSASASASAGAEAVGAGSTGSCVGREVMLLQETLQQQFGKVVRFAKGARGAKHKFLRLAQTNAQVALQSHLSSTATAHQRMVALEQLLGVSDIERMECYDISHTMGELTVASCVVFNREGPDSARYRRYNIDGITPGDDFAAMHQVLTRRFKDPDAGEMPDLIFIDGGPGQLKQAEEVLSSAFAGASHPMPLIVAVAKGEGRKEGLETLIVGFSHERIKLGLGSPALQLVLHIRDEAHRFAITGHRARRAKARRTSRLESIAGVGPKRRQALLKHLGGMQEVTRASVDELQKVPGISAQLATKIYDELHG